MLWQLLELHFDIKIDDYVIILNAMAILSDKQIGSYAATEIVLSFYDLWINC